MTLSRSDGSNAGARWLRHHARSIPRIVWAITGLHVALLFAYSLLVPAFRAPDESSHVDRILQARYTAGVPDYDQVFISRQVFDSLDLMHYGRRSANLLEEEAVPREARPSFSEIAPQHGSTANINLLGIHPPLYYAAMGSISAGIDSLWPGHWSFDRQVGMLRVLNILLIAPLPLLSFLVARRLRWGDAVAVSAAIMPLTIPMLYNIGSTVNNDNLLTLTVSILILLLVRVATGDDTMRTAGWIGVVGGVSLLTKGFALALPLWVVVAYVIGGMRRDVPGGRALAGGGIALGMALLVGGWWWIRNVVLFDALQPGADIDPRPLAPAGFEPDWYIWTRIYASWMMDRFWGAFGRVDVHLPHIVAIVATTVALVGIVLAFVRGAPGGRREATLALLPIATIGAIVTVGAISAYERLATPVGFHGRYLFPGLIGLSTVVALGYARLLGRWRSVLPLLVLGAGIAMHLTAVPVVLEFYWGAQEASLQSRVGSLLAWSPWAPAVGVAIAGTGAVMIGWLVAECVAMSLSSPSSGRIGLERMKIAGAATFAGRRPGTHHRDRSPGTAAGGRAGTIRDPD